MTMSFGPGLRACPETQLDYSNYTALFQQGISYRWQYVVNNLFVNRNSCEIIEFLQNWWNSFIVQKRDVSQNFTKKNTINFLLHI
jgi:hypothetical protein